MTLTFLKSKLFILAICGVVLIVLLVIVLYIFFTSGGNTPAQPGVLPSPTPVQSLSSKEISPLQRAEVGSSTEGEVERLQNIETKDVLQDGSIRYTLTSPLKG